jgi:hypothetical protein
MNTDVKHSAIDSADSFCSSSKEASCRAAGISCGSGSGGGGCSSDNYTSKAFFIPFLAVTAFSVVQETSCTATGGHACAASAVGVGLLAGLTSVGLFKAIKGIRKISQQRTQ